MGPDAPRQVRICPRPSHPLDSSRRNRNPSHPMTLSIAVLGATGVYGRHLVPRLVARGYRVRALVRRPEAGAIAAACGAELFVADVFDAASLRAGLEGCDVGINLATSLPRPSGRGDHSTNDPVPRQGTPIWVPRCRDLSVARTAHHR